MPHSEQSRPFSRSMPPLEEEPLSFTAKMALGAGVVAFAVAFPFVAAGLIVVYVLADWMMRRDLDQTRAERSGESICTFVREFDRHSVDPWILRAVWDELQGYWGSTEGDFPVRSTDRFNEDLLLDAEEVIDVTDRIARRVGRSMGGALTPLTHDSSRTVGDLVRFLNRLPVVSAA